MLGISALQKLSATSRIWRERLDVAQEREALAMAQVAGLPDALSRIMAARGVTLATMEGFLEPRLREAMPSPDVLAGMRLAAEKLANAVQARKKIAIFGDYDVDGACSSALLAGYLRELGVLYQIHIPDRIFEGYGPNIDAIKMLRENGAEMLVTVDCGSTSFEPLAKAKGLGFTTIVLDHHQVGEALPDVDALINPNRQDDISGLGTLCAAGVVFVTLVALNRELRERGVFKAGREPDLMGMLDLVALATVADVVPLTGLNRVLVAQGLKVMRKRSRLGLSALMDVSRLDRPIEAWHLGFLLGPRINAGGRIGDAALGARLLLTEDEGEAKRIAAQLESLNKDRQIVERSMVEEAIAQVETTLGMEGTQAPASVIVTSHADWHPGIVGLVASRLKERFQRPAFAFALGQGQSGETALATGSGRSMPGVDLGAAVRAAVDAGLLVKGGGHAMAAGATIEMHQMAAFSRYLSDRLAQNVDMARQDNALLFDASITAGGATPQFLREMERAGPFGQGNPDPVFVFQNHTLVDCTEVGAGGHLRIRLKSGDGAMLGGIAFRAAGQPLGQMLKGAKGRCIDVLGTLALDLYGGRESLSLRVSDARMDGFTQVQE